MRLLLVTETLEPDSRFLADRARMHGSAASAVLSVRGGEPRMADNGLLIVPMTWSHSDLGELDWRRRHRLRRAASELLGFNAARLFGWEEDILVEVGACDPDVIDLTGVRHGRSWLAELLRRWFPERQVIVERGQAATPDADRWRVYDGSALVTIVLPVHNGERYLRQSIDSCLSQTHSALELVVVDDCSTDATARILAEYAAADDRVRIIRNETNKGLPETLNVGFRAARGRYLTWTSDDNLYSPDALRFMVQQLSTYPDVGFVYTALHTIDEQGRDLNLALCSAPTGLRRHELAAGAVRACFMYRAEVRDTVGPYRAEYRHAEDFDYWVRICLSYKARHYHLPLYRYRLHASSLTAQHRDKWAELNAKILDEHFASGRRNIMWSGP
ncbi:glycosyltransferase family A protein [Alsobacter sp. KACC 23698]|uniref:Glycosyltransferase family A protein n=1 Tax=Alsobacter sp. KACC 23698 TaxID=3149229 RepID=A0AAU7JIN2_9HYPH